MKEMSIISGIKVSQPISEEFSDRELLHAAFAVIVGMAREMLSYDKLMLSLYAAEQYFPMGWNKEKRTKVRLEMLQICKAAAKTNPLDSMFSVKE